ncbi:hypothetical protein KSU17_06470 [Morganella morganii]|nr:hypothetical protein [Morganella morganii]
MLRYSLLLLLITMSAAQAKIDITAIGQCKYSGQLTPEDIAGQPGNGEIHLIYRTDTTGRAYPVKITKNTCDERCNARDAVRILRKVRCPPAPPRYNRRMIIKFYSDTEKHNDKFTPRYLMV